MDRFLAIFLIYGLIMLPITSAKQNEEDNCWGWEKWALAAGAGGAAVAAAPAVLAGAGFASAGVVAGSLAAGIQGSAVASGSLFALAQSAGAAGLATTTKMGIGTVTTLATRYVLGSCEKPCVDTVVYCDYPSNVCCIGRCPGVLTKTRGERINKNI